MHPVDLALTRKVIGFCVLFLLAVVAIRLAQPILDGDLFWHMAYARQMLERHTLILDHTAFSWTPSSNRMIYCAWLSELFFHELWQVAGLTGMFAFRYLCLAGLLVLAWTFSRRLGLARATLTWLLLMILFVATFGGTVVKPEIFSLVFFNVLVWLFFRYRLDGRARWLYFVPLLLLVWVNTHGAFVLAAPFLVAAAIGEALEHRLNRHLLIAWSLCGVAVLATPYGWRYPWQLIEDYAFGRTPRPDAAWNDAYMSIFNPGASGQHYVELLALMAVILVTLAMQKRRFDWTILLINTIYAPLFIVYLRTTFFWPVVFYYSALYLAHLPSTAAMPWSRYGKAAALALFLFLGGRAVTDAWRNPSYGSWLGFGIGHMLPAPEAEFLASARLGDRLYNLFDGGGYLLWRLYPRYRVMTDSRSFPYLAWFDDQYKFSMGDSFDDFLKRYPADVALIDLLHVSARRNFLKSPDWRLVYCGPTAAVFVKRTVPYTGELRSAATEIRNAGTAIQFFDFAAEIGDFSVAWKTLGHIETRSVHQLSNEELDAAHSYREGHRALRTRDWARARQLFDKAFARKSPGDRDQLIRIFLNNIATLRGQGKADQTRTYEAALIKLAAPE